MPLWMLLFLFLLNKVFVHCGNQPGYQPPKKPPRRRPLILTTDADVDDLLAVAYLQHSEFFEVIGITVDSNGWTNAIAGLPNMATTMALAGCTKTPIAYGSESSTFFVGPALPNITLINNIIWGCLKVPLTKAVQPSVYDGATLIATLLTQATEPVDIMVLGTFTNLAKAMQLNSLIIRKIGTLWLSGGNFNYLTPPLDKHWPFTGKNKGSGWNIFLDPVAFHKVIKSGIKNIIAMPSTTQDLLVNNAEDNIRTVKSVNSNVPLDDFFLQLANNFAKCSNQPDEAIQWWDEALAVMAADIVGNRPSFCTAWVNYTVSVNMIDSGSFGVLYSDPLYGVKVQVCVNVSYSKFLPKYWSGLYNNPAYCPKSVAAATPGMYSYFGDIFDSLYRRVMVDDSASNATSSSIDTEQAQSELPLAFVIVVSIMLFLLVVGQVSLGWKLWRGNGKGLEMVDFDHAPITVRGAATTPCQEMMLEP